MVFHGWRRAGALIAAAILALAILALLSERGRVGERKSPRVPVLPASGQGLPSDGMGSDASGSTDERVVGVVRDLADGTPVPGVEVELVVSGTAAPEQTARCVSDGAGRLVIVGGDQSAVARTARIIADGWRTVPLTPEDSGDIWGYRDFILNGVVRVDPVHSPVDWATLVVDALPAGIGGPTTPASQSPHPWSPLWLKGRRVDVTRNLGPVGVDGTFRVPLPRIRGITVRAYAPGWSVAWATLPLDSTTVEADVSLDLHRARRLRGVLVSADGTPIPSATVAAYVVERGTMGDLSYEILRVKHPYGGFTGRWSEKENSAVATSKSVGATDDHGRFDIELCADGEMWVLAYAGGYRVIRQEVGTMHGEQQDELRLTATNVISDSRTQLLLNGVILPKHSVTISDVSFPTKGLQPAFSLETDDKGTISTAWLERGRRYVFSVRGPLVPGEDKSGFGIVTWSGQDAIHFEQLTKDLDE